MSSISEKHASKVLRIPALFQKAQWIWPDGLHWDLHNCYALFRKDFTLPSVPKRAPLWITADQSYQLYVNGTYVCRGPARGFQISWPYDKVDVGDRLKKGRNVIAIRAYNPGFSNFQYVHQGYAGLLLAARWGSTLIVSDVSWKCRRQSGVCRDTVPTSLQLFSQEIIDLRREDPDWMLPDYDDSAWVALASATEWNSMPWHSLEARGIDMLDERVIEIGHQVGKAAGRSAAGYLESRDLALSRFQEGLAHSPVDKKETGPIRFARTGKGRWQSRLIDFGKTHIGCVMLCINGAKGGEIVETHHYETISPENLQPDYDPATHCHMAFAQRMICREGSNHHAFYHPLGFRYMVVTVRDNKAPIQVVFRLRTACYPLEIKGVLESSESGLNSIWQTCAWTQRICSVDAYIDTPWREQAQWWGDARVQAWNTFHLNGETRLLRRGIRQIASQTNPEGITYGHAPTMAHGCILPDFTLIWMLTLWDYYWQTGSLEPFLEHQSELQRMLEYFRRWTHPQTGLLRYDSRYWLFLDWTNLRREGWSSLYSLWFLHALDRLRRMYELCLMSDMAAECQAQSRALRDSLLALIDGEGLMRDGYTPRGKIDPATSIHVQTLAMITGLCPEDETAMLERRLLPYIRGEVQPDLHPSAYWITYVYAVLAERGYGKEVLADIGRRWAPMVEHGSTWENFQPVRAHESYSHAWSAHPVYHLMQILGGVRQAAPDWREINFSPEFYGDWAKVVIPSSRGKIVSTWERVDFGIKGKLILPKGISARVALPGNAPSVVSGSYSYSVSDTE